MNPMRPACTQHLWASERLFVVVAQQLGYGRFEHLPIKGGQLILDPRPTTVRDVKFCVRAEQPEAFPEHFVLKRQLVECFQYVRSIEEGEILTLVVKGGLPFSMEIDHRPGGSGGQHG